MTFKGCPREKELREAMARGQWDAAARTAPDLFAHVASCRSCSDLVLVSNAFRSARAASTATARMVPPGVLWWRAQLRRRNAAMERVTRPLLGAQVFALVFTLLAGAGFVILQAITSGSWRTWLHDLPQNVALRWDDMFVAAAADPAWTWMILGPALLLLGSVAVYMATDRQ
jgi:hypothetical protein